MGSSYAMNDVAGARLAKGASTIVAGDFDAESIYLDRSRPGAFSFTSSCISPSNTIPTEAMGIC
jgi:hypothetical protein